jgi:hypothetical protein
MGFALALLVVLALAGIHILHCQALGFSKQTMRGMQALSV